MGNICKKLKFSDNVYYFNFEDCTCDSYVKEKAIITPKHVSGRSKQNIKKFEKIIIKK